MSSCLIAPCGGELVNLLVPDEERGDLIKYARSLASIQLSPRAVCDLELLASGAFSPLDRFMGRDDYASVIETMRLSDGQIFSIPITLPVDPSETIKEGVDVALYTSENELLAVMTIEEMYEWDHVVVSEQVFGTLDMYHPMVNEMCQWGPVNVSGQLRIVKLPTHYDFRGLRLSPQQTRVLLESYGRENVVAFQTRNPLHRAHEEIIQRSLKEVDGALLLHPIAGITMSSDVGYFTRVRTYKSFIRRYASSECVLLSLLPLAMRMAGPREALWHALIRRNYGANHLIVGRDHAGPGTDSTGKPFYGLYDAQEMVQKHSDELGVKVIPFRSLVYLPDENRYEEVTKVGKNKRTVSISGTTIREEYLAVGKKLPEWFTHSEVADILADAYPPRHKRGVCVWFTGLSGSGKSATTTVLSALLNEHVSYVTVLDGDVIRQNLSKGLGFSKEDRDMNIRRIAFVAGEIVKHGGIVICATISPYHEARMAARKTIGADQFVQVFVDTPLHVCEERDPKGLYAKARRGEITQFTGIDDPYEYPDDSEIVIGTVAHTAYDNAYFIRNYLMSSGFIRNGEEE